MATTIFIATVLYLTIGLVFALAIRRDEPMSELLWFYLTCFWPALVALLLYLVLTDLALIRKREEK